MTIQLMEVCYAMRKFLPIVLAYVLALFVAFSVIKISSFGLLLDTLLADVAGTFVIFVFSRIYKNSSFYDAYWSLVPAVIAMYWWWSLSGEGANELRAYVVIGLVCWWGIRLTLNWASHWEGMSHEDWRYAPIRKKAGQHEMFADLAAIHVFPTLMVFVACLPIYAVMKFGTSSLYFFDYVAISFTAGAILIETISDIQLHRFLKTKKPGEFIKTGLWKYSRHPNYFGELSFWIGLSLLGLASYPSGWWWIVPGAISMALMFVFVSIPLMDERSLERREGYAEHMNRTSNLIPLPPK